MAIYNETSTSGIKVAGCALIKYVDMLVTAFGPGDILYNVHKARIGILEKIAIKKPKLISSGPYVVYVDTFNAIWNENDLVSSSDARTLARDYLESELLRLELTKFC